MNKKNNMKSFVLSIFFTALNTVMVFSQTKPGIEPVDSLKIWNFSRPFPSSENFIFSHSNFRWKPKTEYNFFNLSAFSGEFTKEMDLLTVNTKFFYIGGLSAMDTKGPYAMMYFLPFGFKLPLFNCRNFSLVLGNYYYLLPSHNNVPGHTKYFDNFHINEGSDLDILFPRFIDNQVRIETNFIIGLSAFIGYRIQLSEYTITNSSSNVVLYTSNSLNGFYAGISANLGLLIPMSYGIKRCYNVGQSEYRQLGNSEVALQAFINKYPGTPYAVNASKKIEYLAYYKAINGTLQLCNDYLRQYPSGSHTNLVQKRKDDFIEYDAYYSAKTGDITDCDNYLKKYPDGKYVESVNNLKTDKYNKIEADNYNYAFKGSYIDCDNYIQKYPNGKFINEVRRLRSEKYDREETEYYHNAVNGTIKNCDYYIQKYPGGKYISEVEKLKTEKYDREEADIYKQAVTGSYQDCDRYLQLYPNGKHAAEINKYKSEQLNKVENNDVASVQQLTDQTLLSKIALTHQSSDVRGEAIEKLTDQVLLTKIALNSDEEAGNRVAAIEKIKSQAVLTRIVRTDHDQEVRQAAVERITDQAILIKMAGKSEESSTRILAISQIKDQSLLQQWAHSDPQAAIRQIAIEQITDDSFLLNRMSQEPSSAVRTSIISMLHEKQSIRTLALTAYYLSDRDYAFKRLTGGFKDPAEDVYSAQNELNRRVKSLHDEKDNNKLLEILLKGEFDVLRLAAVQQMNDVSLLEKAALQCSDREVLAVLLNKINDQSSLIRISGSAKDKALRLAAAKKSGKKTWITIFDDVTSKGSPAYMLGDAIAAVSLFSETQSDAVEGVQEACLNLIRKGDESRIPEMADLLEAYGDKTLAEDYLNCGQPDLDDAARDWCSRRGYNIGRGYGSNRARWGSGGR